MQTVPILAYHSISDLTNKRYDRWCVSQKRFRQQMSVLADGGYTVLTTSGMVDCLNSGCQLPARCAVLTFDDGLQDFLTGAVPVLRQFDFPATLYVVAGLVGQTSRWLQHLGEGSRPMLHAEDLRELAASGIEIGGHSMTHPELDVLNYSRALEEIRTSRLVLEDILDIPVRAFAYPHGYASRTTRRITHEAGYTSAVRVRHAMSQTSENIFGLSRLIVTEELDAVQFAAILEDSDVPIAPSQDRLIADCWRVTRRLLHSVRHPDTTQIARPL